MDAALLRRLDDTEDRARAVALRGFPALARRHVLDVGRAWLALNPVPTPDLLAPAADPSWSRGPVARLVRVAARGYAVGDRLERAIEPPPGVVLARPRLEISAAAALPIREDEEAIAAEIVEAQVRPAIEQAAADLDAAMVRALVRLTLRAVSQGWTVERYQGAVQRAIATMGGASATFQTSWIASWYRTLLTSVWAQGLDERLRQEPTARLWPYLEYVPRRDDRVRPNHAHLRGFAAPPGWFGWRQVGPANGYNCRCRFAPISWQEARARGWSGLLPGRSESILSTWSGPDPGFRVSSNY